MREVSWITSNGKTVALRCLFVIFFFQKPLVEFLSHSFFNSFRRVDCKSDASTYLCHESIRSCTLLILKYNVLVIIGHQVLEPGVVPVDPALGESTGGEHILRHIRHMLFEYQRRQLPRSSSPSRSTARAAGLSPSHEEGDQERRTHHRALHLQEALISLPALRHYSASQVTADRTCHR